MKLKSDSLLGPHDYDVTDVRKFGRNHFDFLLKHKADEVTTIGLRNELQIQNDTHNQGSEAPSRVVHDNNTVVQGEDMGLPDTGRCTGQQSIQEVPDPLSPVGEDIQGREEMDNGIELIEVTYT